MEAEQPFVQRPLRHVRIRQTGMAYPQRDLI